MVFLMAGRSLCNEGFGAGRSGTHGYVRYSERTDRRLLHRGMIGKMLAATRPDLVGALMTCTSAARMGTPDMWQDRIAAVQQGGLAPVADGVMARWFSPAFQLRPEIALWRNMLRATIGGWLRRKLSRAVGRRFDRSNSRAHHASTGRCRRRRLGLSIRSCARNGGVDRGRTVSRIRGGRAFAQR